MADKEKEPPNQSKSLTDSDSSDDSEVNPRFKTSVEERQYNTIPGSATATCVALSYSRMQMNPTVINNNHESIRLDKCSRFGYST